VAKRRRKNSRNYFTQETEDAIVRYNNSSCFDEKSKIYRNEIHYAFFKLTENIIHTFKFYYTEVDKIEHLQQEVIIFLLSKIHLFDPSKGAKAYSYFGTITKNWLIIYNTKNYKKRIKKAPVEDLYKDETYSYNLEDDRVADKLSFFIDQYVCYVEERFDEFFPKGNDAQVADAILELFRKRENLEIFNKKALYIYIREIMATNGLEVKTPKITKIAGKLYGLFKDNYISFLERGYVEFEKV
jgi:DNA-directed RNA polymerase specialized sigma24 family protein|tara:strand:- start:162 stop:887 length:726 start_codon:yes stop_codon:yes gene_type:complete